MIEVEQKVRQIPVWLTCLIVAACLAGGGWLVYGLLWSSSGDRLVTLQHDPDDGVRFVGENRWVVRAGSAILSVNQAKPESIELALSFLNELTPEQSRMLRASSRLARDKALAAKLNLSADQGRKLKDLSKTSRIGLSPDAAAHLRTLWTSYQAAAEGPRKVAAESNLVQAVDEATAPLRDPVRQTDLALVGKFAIILSPGQWKQYEALK